MLQRGTRSRFTSVGILLWCFARRVVHVLFGQAGGSRAVWPSGWFTCCLARRVVHVLFGQAGGSRAVWPGGWFTWCLAKRVVHVLGVRLCQLPAAARRPRCSCVSVHAILARNDVTRDSTR